METPASTHDRAITISISGKRSSLVAGTTADNAGTPSNPELASHPSLAARQHPLALRDGHVDHSSGQIFGARQLSYGNGTTGVGTLYY
ncbi:hypothetical protein [Tahibacter aquaticus]|uniref:hypothetical protein n=1 Tax=Tahibacter aquaticus TaxID=520092 RepID=UPI001060E108|nr:hypothetical protein [Tahibacter aquaticus]